MIDSCDAVKGVSYHLKYKFFKEKQKMAKAKYDNSKPHVNIGTIGHVDHGYHHGNGLQRSGGKNEVRRDR